MGEVLIFGGSGQIGQAVLSSLPAESGRVLAVSRHRRSEVEGDGDGVRWLQGELDLPPSLPARFDVIFSCGPLDAFARWYAKTEVRADRVVAFGSTSVATKQDSAEPAERDLAHRLAQAEQQVLDLSAARGAAATMLRPTLVYGAGRDASLTRIASLGRRWGRFPLPRGANGLRQPVHVDDLAAAAIACLGSSASHGRAYALPGGETLPYREMVARVLASLQPPARLLELPAPVFTLALRLAQAGGQASGLGAAAVARMRSDLVFDVHPARRDLGYAPRPFHPDAAMFQV